MSDESVREAIAAEIGRWQRGWTWKRRSTQQQVADIPILLRQSELGCTQWARGFDGLDGIDVLMAVEAGVGRLLSEECPYWEFPIIEFGQALYFMSEGLRASADTVCEIMGWRAKRSDSMDARHAVDVCTEVIAIVLGIPFSECTGATRINDLLGHGVAESEYYSQNCRLVVIRDLVARLAGVADSRSKVRQIERSITKEQTIAECAELACSLG